MVNYQEARVKLTNTQLNKLKSASKNEIRAVLRLFLTTRQTTKIRNTFANNMSTDIKLSKTQKSKIIQWAGSFRSWLGNLGMKTLTNIAIPLARENKWKRTVRAGKGFPLYILNEDINDIIKIIKSLEDSGVLIDGITETVKD